MKVTLGDVCNGFNIDDVGDFSDSYHTFTDLYYQRAALFATTVNTYPELSWKAYKHEDGKHCLDSVGIDTPEGLYTYHYEKEY